MSHLLECGPARLAALLLLVLGVWVGTPTTAEAACGDNVIDCSENCDDGNVTAGDGCNQYCRVEYGFNCPGVTAFSPIANWRLDEISGTVATDSSGTSNGGYVGPLLGASGADPGTRTSATFDGVDDHVLIPHAGAFLVDAGTISLWFKADKVPAGTDPTVALFSKDHEGLGNGGHISLTLSGGRLRYRLQVADQGLGNDGDACATAADCNGDTCLFDATKGFEVCGGSSKYVYWNSPTAGVWTHVAATFGPDGMLLYVNGALVSSYAYVGGLSTTSGGSGNTQPIALGASLINAVAGTSAPMNGFFDGQIDEVSFFDYQLTVAELGDFLDGETCSTPGGACTAGTPVGCGDGSLDPFHEECDDSNTTAGDGCNSLCLVEHCGDGLINNAGTETCDDGNRRDGDGCARSCAPEAGWSCAGEPSACNKTSMCGNGIPEPGEVCDNAATCSADCKRILTCGDGVVDAANLEECDDFNVADMDGCSATCKIESGWTCSESTADSYWVYPLYPSVCVTACGDGVIAGTEECDDTNTMSGDGCDARCRDERCGDGFRLAPEACDDGNVNNGDGCNDTCTVDAGWVCPSGAGRCVPQTTCDLDATYIATNFSGGYIYQCPFNETYDGDGDLIPDCPSMYTIAKMQNLPPFEVVAGDTRFSLDAYTVSATPVIATIEFATAIANGSSQPAGPWTMIVNNGTATTNGNGSIGDIDLRWLATGNFSFPGGGLLIRITEISGTLYVLSGIGGNGISSYVYRDTDGVYPWDQTYETQGLAIKIETGVAVCKINKYGNCVDIGGGVGECKPKPWNYPNTDVWCGDTGQNCEANDSWYYSSSSTSRADGATCAISRVYKRDYYCLAAYDTCSYTSTYFPYYDRFCEHCDDSDPCTSTSFSTSSGCLYSSTGDVSCWDGVPGKRNVGACSDGVNYCRNPGPECIGASYGSSEACDGIDNDCNATIDDPVLTDPLCDDSNPLTSDTCTGGVCDHIQLCLGTDLSCGTSVPCEDCTASSGWTLTGNSGPCCDGLDSCTCDEYELRTYYCGGTTCDYLLEPVSPTYQIVPGSCSTCDDSNICTTDSCVTGAGVCSNVDSGYAGSCYYGPAGTEGIGICSGGTEACVAGTLGACDDVQPGSELCNNLDDDCNNAVDDGDADTSCPVGEDCWSGQCDNECLSTADCAGGETCYFENGVAQVDRIICPPNPETTVGVGHTYEFRINGTTITYTDDGTPTTVEICAGLGAAANASGEPVLAAASGNYLDITAVNSLPFTITNVDLSLTLFVLQPGISNLPGRCAPTSGPCDDVVCPPAKSCFEGSCTSSNCGNDLDCNAYSKCYNSGRCLNDPDDRCNGVQCPQGDECVKGSCKPPCNSNADCSAGNRCLDGFCFQDVDPCEGVDCQLSEVCYQNNCFEQCAVDADCSDPGDVCYDASRCGPASDPCAGVACPLGDICYEGSCYSICGTTVDCSNPANLCYDATRCAIDNCDGVQCPQNEACQGGVCYLVCTDDVDCASIGPTHACWGGFCKTGPCDGVQCATDQVCSGGVCYFTCVDDADCTIYDPGHACYGGLCTDDPCASVLCGVGEVCWGGSCYGSCTASTECDPGEPVCWDAAFCGTTDPCAGVACGSSEVCYQGACYEDCSLTMTCTDPNEICWNSSYCSSGPCVGVLCPAEEFCYGGSCYLQCTTDLDCTDPSHACYDGRCAASACEGVVCGPAEVCYEGTCYQSCTGSIDCSDPAHICYNNLCQDPCDTVSCGGGETCYLGTCYEYCDTAADCSDPSSICYDNRCVDENDPWCDGVNCPGGESCYRGTCYEYCATGADCTDPNSICYDNACVPTDCSGTACDAGEVCYNGVCYEDCSDGTCDDPADICYDNMRCAGSACEAQAQNVIDAYDNNHIFHQAGRRLHAVQLSQLPWLWPRPYSETGMSFATWVDVPTGVGVSSDNDALYTRGSARVVIYYDDTDSNSYFLYLIHGSKDGTQGAAEATYSIRVRGVDPDVVLMDDRGAEAYSESPDSDGWRHIQAHVSSGPSETAGIAIGKFPANSDTWQLEIAANFSGDIQRWELMNGEKGAPQAELSIAETLSIRTTLLAATDEIQPEFGTSCDTGQPGICGRGTVTECLNWQLTCDQTVFPWSFEICDGVDNTCNGFVDADDSSLQYALSQSRQRFESWRPWPTIDSPTGVGDWLNYRPANAADDRKGWTDAKRQDGSPLQDPTRIVFAMHRNMPTGAFSMPAIVGAWTNNNTSINSASTELSATWRMTGRGGTRIEEAFVCWYDDRTPATTNDEILKRWDRTNQRVEWTSDLAVENGELEADTVAIRPQWLEGVTGRATHLRMDRDASDNFIRTWRRYAPALRDLPLNPSLSFHARVKGVDPDEAFCISDTPSPNGCVVGVYMCTAGGIQCGPADDDNCTAGCTDADFDGHILFDPVLCSIGDDCDDMDPSTYPGALEYCDGRDNDCDEKIDLQTTGVCSNGQTICGPEDCGGVPVCLCPAGAVERPGDPIDTCVCGEGLTP